MGLVRLLLFPPGACARFIHDVRLGAEHENMFGHCGHTRASVPHAAHGGRFPGFKAGLASMPVQSLRLNKSLYYTTEHNRGVLETVRANPMQSARHITELAEETSQQSLVIVVSPIWTTHVLQKCASEKLDASTSHSPDIYRSSAGCPGQWPAQQAKLASMSARSPQSRQQPSGNYVSSSSAYCSTHMSLNPAAQGLVFRTVLPELH